LQRLRHAHQELVDALVADEGEDRAVFEHQWDESSDLYRLLFDPTMRPYVDSTGKRVTTQMMFTARRSAEEKDYKGFSRATKLARRREHRAKEWDQYRMLDSKVVLPFVSSRGEFIDANMIRERRAQRDAEGKSEHGVHISTNRVEKCRSAKQWCEHQLLLCQRTASPQSMIRNILKMTAIHNVDSPLSIQPQSERKLEIIQESHLSMLPNVITPISIDNVNNIDTATATATATAAMTLQTNDKSTQQHNLQETSHVVIEEKAKMPLPDIPTAREKTLHTVTTLLNDVDNEVTSQSLGKMNKNKVLPSIGKEQNSDK
jgi:hypothetical protein